MIYMNKSLHLIISLDLNIIKYIRDRLTRIYIKRWWPPITITARGQSTLCCIHQCFYKVFSQICQLTLFHKLVGRSAAEYILFHCWWYGICSKLSECGGSIWLVNHLLYLIVERQGERLSLFFNLYMD